MGLSFGFAAAARNTDDGFWMRAERRPFSQFPCSNRSWLQQQDIGRWVWSRGGGAAGGGDFNFQHTQNAPAPQTFGRGLFWGSEGPDPLQPPWIKPHNTKHGAKPQPACKAQSPTSSISCIKTEAGSQDKQSVSSSFDNSNTFCSLSQSGCKNLPALAQAGRDFGVFPSFLPPPHKNQSPLSPPHTSNEHPIQQPDSNFPTKLMTMTRV